MKIALCHDLPSGGALRMVACWAHHLSRSHSIDLFVLGSAERGFVDLGPSVGRTAVFDAPEPIRARPIVGPLGHLGFLRRLDRAYRTMAAAVDAGGYDVAFVHSCRLSHSPSVLEHLETPSVYVLQEPARRLFEGPPARALRDRLVGWAARRAERRAARAAGRVLANSEFSAGNIRRLYGLEPSVVRLGVDDEVFHPEPSAVRERRVISVGAISPAKGFRFLVDALARIERDRPALLVAGDRTEPGEAEELARRAGAAGVELAIRLRVPDPELARLYARSLAFVYAPHAEPFGLAPLEAMACGTPVVAVGEGGVLETVGSAGILVERDETRFAARLSELLADPTRVEEMARLGRTHVEASWSLEASSRAIEQELRQQAATGGCPSLRRD